MKTVEIKKTGQGFRLVRTTWIMTEMFVEVPYSSYEKAFTKTQCTILARDLKIPTFYNPKIYFDTKIKSGGEIFYIREADIVEIITSKTVFVPSLPKKGERDGHEALCLAVLIPTAFNERYVLCKDMSCDTCFFFKDNFALWQDSLEDADE